MKPKETKRFEILYDRHLKKLTLQGKSQATISAYAWAVRRLAEHFDCCPDQLSVEQLKDYFPVWSIIAPGAQSNSKGSA